MQTRAKLSRALLLHEGRMHVNEDKHKLNNRIGNPKAEKKKN